jgi:hypothetical protein
VLDDDGAAMLDDNGDFIYEYTYGVYFPPKYSAVICWVGVKPSTGSTVRKKFSASGTLLEIKESFNTHVRSWHTDNNTGLSQQVAEVDFFALLVKPGDPIIVVPPASEKELNDQFNPFKNRTQSRMLNTNRELENPTPYKSISKRGVATRLETSEEG